MKGRNLRRPGWAGWLGWAQQIAAIILVIGLVAVGTMPVGAAVSVDADGEAFQINSGDPLFRFEGAVPGDTLRRTIPLHNRYGGPVALYLRTEPSTRSTPAEREASQKLLERLELRVEIRDGQAPDRLLYTGSAAGDIEENILLANLEAGQRADILVQLHIPVRVGNELADAAGRVDWIFTAIGDLPDTGADTPGVENTDSPGGVAIADGEIPRAGARIEDSQVPLDDLTVIDEGLVPLGKLPKTGAALLPVLAAASIAAGILLNRRARRKALPEE